MQDEGDERDTVCNFTRRCLALFGTMLRMMILISVIVARCLS
jgi:hypothetical protein